MSDSQFLSQGVDYLGFLDSQLRNLRGYATLANEFLQNADDATATKVIFEFQSDALHIENDAQFSDCGHVEEYECPWRDSELNRRCDFHSFRRVAAGDKRNRPDAIGAFGIGFISAYQITDKPELSSGNRHWKIRPHELEDRRIEQVFVQTSDKTIFRLPWALDGQSVLRLALHVEPVTRDRLAKFEQELERALPSAILFLRYVNVVELIRHGAARRSITRIKDGDQIVVADSSGTELWQLLRGTFENEAALLRKEVPGRIENKRKADVTIAVPTSVSTVTGLLCAYLPTEHQTGLPFHINADFFPNSDRKRILLESGDYQERWNKAAIRAGARSIADSLLSLRDLLGHKGIWTLLQNMDTVAKEAKDKQREEIFAAFWEAAAPRLRDLEIVKTTAGQWKKADQVFLLAGTDEEDAIPLLEQMGLSIVHSELRSAYNLLRGAELGVRVLALADLATALRNAGLDRRVKLAVAPEWIRTSENRQKLAKEIQALLGQRLTPATRLASTQEITACAIATSRTGELVPPAELRRTSDLTARIFEPYGFSSMFLGFDNPEVITELTPAFSLQDALRALELVPQESWDQFWQQNPLEVITLIGWFADHRAELRQSEHLRERLKKLPIWPSGNRLRALTELVVPGNFDDPLHLARIVDSEVLLKYRDFVIELGGEVLTIATYATSQVPRAFTDTHSLNAEARRSLLQLLAAHVGELQGPLDVKNALASCPLVECDDGIFRTAAETYFDNKIVSKTLGKNAHRAVLPKANAEAVAYALKWLGVSGVPRSQDILARVREIIKVVPNAESRRVIQEIFSYVGALWREDEADLGYRFRELRFLSWLPGRTHTERWYRPHELYAIYSSYLFDTQAEFLDVSQPEQIQSRNFIVFLQMPIEPSVGQVVKHLLFCAQMGREVNRAVYTWLNQKSDDPAIALLKGTKCLFLPGIGYVRPDQVYWGTHPFGPYRFQLSSDYRVFTSLFERLDVRETPDAADAIRVLQEICAKYGPPHRPLSEENVGVVMECWRLLEHFLEKLAEDLIGTLRTLDSVPDDRAVLQPPHRMFFDDRPGLASKFSDLIQHNVIVPPLGAWRAMESAGVRPLSKAVNVALAECDNPSEAKDLRQVVEDRRSLIARVLEANGPEEGSELKLDLLRSLRIQQVSRLEISYTLKAFGQTRMTPPESVAAFFDIEGRILYFHDDVPPPWAAIARELAHALNPAAEAAKLASGLKDVLSAPSFDQAQRNLDELGYPPLETELPAVTASQPVSFGEPVQTVPEALANLGITASPTPVPAGLDQPDRILPGPTTPGTGGSAAPTGGGGPDGAGGQSVGTRTAGPRKKRSRLRTYVTPEGTEHQQEEEDPKDTALEKAAVAKVLEYESGCRRNPVEMPPKYPGYDIESKNLLGLIERYIEVKGVAGDWDALGVGVSRTQFKRASELGQSYWLYVVERAEQSDYEIHRIQDPARKVDQFFYDDGWTALSESVQAEVERKADILNNAKQTTIAEIT